MPAEFRDIFSFDLPAKSRRFAHGIRIRFGGIAAMATRTSKALLVVNVAGELLFGDLEWRIKRGVAIQAGVLRLRPCRPGAQSGR